MTDPEPPGATRMQIATDEARLTAAFLGLDARTDPFVAAVRATRMPMIVTDPRQADNPVVFANDAFCRMTGYERGEILGRNCRFLQGPQTDSAAREAIHHAVARRESIEIDIRNYRKSGDPFWNRLLLAPVFDAAGELAYFFASQVDVTFERERVAGLEGHNAALTAELAGRLREQQERESELRFALEAGKLGSWTLDLRALTLSTSSSLRREFGRDPTWPFTANDLREAVLPEDRNPMAATVRRSIESGADCEVEFRIITPAGELRWIAARARPIRGLDGTVSRLSGVSQDITARRRADRLRDALDDLGREFRDGHDPPGLIAAAARILGETLGVARAGFGSVDPDAETVMIEPDWHLAGVTSIAGVLRFRDFGSHLDDLRRGETVAVAAADRDDRTRDTVDSLRSIASFAFVNVPVTEGGRLVALLFVTQPTPREWHRDEVAFMGEVATRTRFAIERRRAEQRLAELAASLEGQVAERTRELMATEEALRHSQKMEAIGQLTGGVAHDFNNLLTVIRSSVDLMRRPNLPEERRRRYMDAISETVARASRLTGQLLAFGRRQALKPEVFDVGERLQSIAEMLDTVTGARIRVVVHQPATPCAVRADVSQFETALVNIAVNARDAMNGEGVLTLRLRHSTVMPSIRGHAGTDGRFVALSMTDTGSGIPAEALDRIFEPFFTTKEVGKGTGLGLSQVFGFAKQSGGDVEVSSQPGRGATFTLYLPEVDYVQPAAEEGSGAVFATHVAGGAGRRVLVVEDNVEVGQFSTQVLQDLGYETTWANNAEDAIERLAASPQPFDVVFSDVVMPGRSGVELARELRVTRPGLPVVLTSGYSHVLAEEGTEGFELLHKPYSAEQLSRVLRRACAAGGRHRA